MEVSNAKPRKRKQLKQTNKVVQIKGETREGKDLSHQPSKTPRGVKRSLKNEATCYLQQRDASTPWSDTAGSTDEYRSLRLKYLLLEDESVSLERELEEADAQVKTLEEEKLALLDQLVVLEGLVDPSETHY